MCVCVCGVCCDVYVCVCVCMCVYVCVCVHVCVCMCVYELFRGGILTKLIAPYCFTHQSGSLHIVSRVNQALQHQWTAVGIASVALARGRDMGHRLAKKKQRCRLLSTTCAKQTLITAVPFVSKGRLIAFL